MRHYPVRDNIRIGIPAKDHVLGTLVLVIVDDAVPDLVLVVETAVVSVDVFGCFNRNKISAFFLEISIILQIINPICPCNYQDVVLVRIPSLAIGIIIEHGRVVGYFFNTLNCFPVVIEHGF